MSDPTEYIRGKMEERGYSGDATFLQDGFQRWAETEHPDYTGILAGGKMPRRRRATLQMPKNLAYEVNVRTGMGMCTGSGRPCGCQQMECMCGSAAPAAVQFEGAKQEMKQMGDMPKQGEIGDAFKAGLAESAPAPMMNKPTATPAQQRRMMGIQKNIEKVQEQLKTAAGPTRVKKQRELDSLQAEHSALMGSGLFSSLGKLGKTLGKAAKKGFKAAKSAVKKVATKENFEKLKKAAKKGAEMYVEAKEAGIFEGSREERLAKGKQLAQKKLSKRFMPPEEEEEEPMDEEEPMEGEGFMDLLKKGVALGKKYATKENLAKAKGYAKQAKQAYSTAKELGLTTGSTKEKLAKAKALALAEGKKRAMKAVKDFDRDGIPDSKDKDDDNDGVPDKKDSNDNSPPSGSGKPRRRRAPSKRNIAVAKVMRERGVSLGEASKIVKQEGLA